MEVEYRLTEEDLVAFARYQRDRNPGHKWLVYVPLFVVLALILTIPLLLGQGGFDPLMLIPFGTMALAVLFGIFTARRSMPRQMARQLIRQGEKAKILGAQRMRITPQGLTNVMELTAGAVDWAALERIDVSGEHAFFYLLNTTAFILPKRAFGSERDFDDFVATAKRYHDEAKAAGSS